MLFNMIKAQLYNTMLIYSRMYIFKMSLLKHPLYVIIFSIAGYYHEFLRDRRRLPIAPILFLEDFMSYA